MMKGWSTVDCPANIHLTGDDYSSSVDQSFQMVAWSLNLMVYQADDLDALESGDQAAQTATIAKGQGADHKSSRQNVFCSVAAEDVQTLE